MRLFVKIIFALFLFFLPTPAFVRQMNTARDSCISLKQDTLSVGEATPQHSDDDFAPGLFFFALFGCGCICMFVAAGAMLALVATFMFIGLAALGIFSTSLIVALRKKSLEKGFKTLIVLFCSSGGLLSLAVLFPFVNYIIHWATFEKAVFIGAVIGASSGFALGQIVFSIARRLFLYLQKKMDVNE